MNEFEKPVLVVGLPRSGTTWIGKVFDSHPGTLYLHEPDSAVPMRDVPPLIGSAPGEGEADRLRASVARTMNVRLTRVAGSLPRFRKAYRSPGFDWLHQRMVFSAKLWSRAFGEVRIPDLASASNQPPRLVWKSIESVGRIGMLARLAPEFRVIHILRHPCGWMRSFGRGYQERLFTSERDDWADFRLLESTPPAQRRGLAMSSFREMDDIERDTWLWILWNENGVEGGEGLSNVLTVRYEDVCAAPVAQSRMIFRFAELDWHPNTENFIYRSISTSSERYYSVFRDPLTAANRWRQSFSGAQLHRVEAIMEQSHVGRMFLS
jgi:hypothetical protein